MEEKQTIMAVGAGAATKLVLPPDARKALEAQAKRQAELSSEKGCDPASASAPARYIFRAENVKDVALYIKKVDEMVERKKKLFENG